MTRVENPSGCAGAFITHSISTPEQPAIEALWMKLAGVALHLRGVASLNG